MFGTLWVSRWPSIRCWLLRVDTTQVVIKASCSSHCRLTSQNASVGAKVRSAKSASKFQADARCESRRKMARRIVRWNRRTGTCTHVFCWRGLCWRRSSVLRNCWFKLTFNLLKRDFMYTHGTHLNCLVSLKVHIVLLSASEQAETKMLKSTTASLPVIPLKFLLTLGKCSINRCFISCFDTACSFFFSF